MANLLNEKPPAFYNTTQRCSGGDFHRGQYNYGTWPSTVSLPGSGTYQYCLYASGPLN